jgi:NAD(P)-dependent dehydrogenase (short-subunit alcohol dehydrogenase family)
VALGPIWTPLQVSGGATMEKLQKFGDDTPLGRPGQPAELASIYVQLADALRSHTSLSSATSLSHRLGNMSMTAMSGVVSAGIPTPRSRGEIL